MEFKAYPKITRLFSEVVITEKLDGTNACVAITEDGEVFAQSRSKIITPDADNYGFAQWVARNKDSLLEMGAGYHYGEWWGSGIQRRYNVPDKRFSLFAPRKVMPECVSLVPVLYEGVFDPVVVARLEDKLKTEGSVAAPGFMQPEGFMIYFKNNGMVLKHPFGK